jgi:intein/homing endonuclease
MQVIKRDGRTVPYDLRKIKEAITKAFKAVHPDIDNELSINDVADQVNMKLMYNKTAAIEEIQDLVEKALMEKHHYEVAKAYILYRDKRNKERLLTTGSMPEDVEFQKLCDKNSEAFGNNAMRQFVYTRTYSRWAESKGRREVWSETVDRYMEFLKVKIGDKLSEVDYGDMRQYIFEQKVMPSMRLLQFAGPAASRCNVCVYNCAFSAPSSFKDLADIMYLSMSGTGVGFSVEEKNVSKFPNIMPTNGIHVHMVIDDSKEGWCDALQFGLIKWFEGTKVVFDYSKLRPSGARLKIMGGRSSGPGPLMDLMKFTEEIIEKRRTTTHRLTTLDVHDIICKIGQIVVSGGVRRSALISLSDFKDQEIRDCKKGNFWLTDTQRCLANNSAAYDQKPDQLTFMKEWISLAESGTGERGIFNRGSLSKVIPQRRVDLVGDKLGSFGMNPCVTADAWIQTVEGPRQVRDLIGQKVDLVVNGKTYPMESEGFFHTGDKQVYEVQTLCGYFVTITEDHPLLEYKTQKWTTLKELKDSPEHRTICLSNHSGLTTWPGRYTFEEGQADSHHNLCDEDTSSEYHRGYLSEFFNIWKDKTYVLDVCAEYSDQQIILSVQRMLIRFGIISNILSGSEKGKWQIRVIGGQSKLFRFLFWGEGEKPTENYSSSIYGDRIESITKLGIEPVYDVTVAEVHEFCANGLRLHNCVTGDTWVQTVEGPFQAKELLNKNIDIIVNGLPYKTESNGFFHTGRKPVFEIETKRGLKVKLTGDHPMLKYTESGLIWTKLEQLKIGDSVMTSNHRNINIWEGTGGTFGEGWLIGQIVGDGGIILSNEPNKQNSGYVRFWGESAKSMAEIALEYVKTCCEHRSDLSVVYNEGNKTHQVKCVGLYKLCIKYGITHEKETTSVTEKTSVDFQIGFVRGFFDADGSVQGTPKAGFSIRLSQSNISRLEVVQRMLSRIGIGSSIIKERRGIHMSTLPDGKGGSKEYLCKAQHELLVSAENIKLFALCVGFHQPAKTARLEEIISLRYSTIDIDELAHDHYNETIHRESSIYPGKYTVTKQEAAQASKSRWYVNRYGWKFQDSIISITPVGVEDVYDVTVAEVHEFCANGFRVSNCGEILLQPFQFCNLTEVVLRDDDTWEQVKNKMRVATLIGTCQAYFSDFKYIDPKWKVNQEAERLLGVSLTGIYDYSPMTEAQLYDLRVNSVEWNKKYAKKLGISPATAITCVKPSGTVSQMVDSSSGIHPRFAEYYIRRIRISATDPLLKFMKEQGYPCLPEVGQFEPNVNTYVLEFPVQAPKGSKTVKDVSALSQLETWLHFKRNYTEHNPSVTIYVKADEWLAIGNWVWDNWDYITGLSFLPYSDHIYELAPYEAITSEKYLELSSKIGKVDFSKLRYYEKVDNTDVKKEVACVGGLCEL